MKKPGVPEDEAHRIRELCALSLLDTPPEERFDRITRTAVRLFGVPIALVSLVDRERQWFKSKQGLDADETPRDVSFCGHAILGREPFVVANALKDPRFSDNPLVTGEPHIRFYAGCPLRSVEGRSLGTLCIIDRRPRRMRGEDIEALKSLASWAERELNQVPLLQALAARTDSEAHTRSILENMLGGLITFDESGTIGSLNPAALRILGYEREELAGENLTLLVPETVAPTAAEYLKEAHRRSLGRVTEWSVRRKNGETFPAQISLFEYAGPEGRHFAANFWDLTQLKEVERLKREFVSMVSHELRTPLTSIRGSLGLLAGGVAGEMPPQAGELLSIALKNSERLVLLINDLLDLEKIESGRMEFRIAPVDLMAVVEQALEANRGYGEQFEVRFELVNRLSEAAVKADPDRLAQVLANLLSNAAKFSPRGGVVEVAVTRAGERVRVSVRDAGPGIPEEFRSRIFQRFAQADSSDSRKKGGTGLGLSICKAILERMGGDIGFDSEVGQGSTFYFDLSLAGDPGPPASGKKGRDPSRARILVVEDDPDVGRLLEMMLAQGGFAVDRASCVAEALARLEEGGHDAMTLDLVLPDGDGLSLIRRLRQSEATRTLPIIIVSGHIKDSRSCLEGETLEVLDWIEKPIDQDRLMEAVGRATGRQTRKPRVLHVEDDPDVIRVVAMVLGERVDLVPARTIEEARALLSRDSFDQAIIDMALPDGKGIDLLPDLKARSGGPLPVIIFSASEVPQEEVRKVAAALVKSKTTNEELLRAIRSALGRRTERSASQGGGHEGD